MEMGCREELVSVEAGDGVILTGVVMHPVPAPDRPRAVVWIAGLSINFYHPSFVLLGREMTRRGVIWVMGSHRGHDLGAHLWHWAADRQNKDMRPG